MNCKVSISKIAPVLILSISVVAGCRPQKDAIIIGSKNFTEQIILSEIMSILIEENTDLQVIRRLNLGGTFVCFNSLKRGEIDLYAEYTGTGLTAILGMKEIPGKEETYGIVEAQFRDRFNLVWLEPFGFNNTYTITMRKGQAEKLSIEQISDLKRYKDILKPGFNHEFMERPDGYRGLSQEYDLHFRNEPKEVDTGLMYKAIAEKEVDLICGFATDGRIPAFGLVMLEDDLGFFPPYYAAPLIRAETLEKHPAVGKLLRKLGGLISDAEMRKMNYKVDEQGMKAKKVARELLREEGLI